MIDEQQIQNKAGDAMGLATGLQALAAFPVTDDPACQMATDLAHQIRDHRRTLEAELKGVTKPINDALKRVRGWFKPPIAALEGAEQQLKGSIAQYRLDCARQRAALLAEARSHEEIVEAQTALAPRAAGLQERNKWSAVVINPDLVPREYLMVDVAKLDAAARLHKDKLDIPGVKVRHEKTVALV